MKKDHPILTPPTVCKAEPALRAQAVDHFVEADGRTTRLEDFHPSANAHLSVIKTDTWTMNLIEKYDRTQAFRRLQCWN